VQFRRRSSGESELTGQRVDWFPQCGSIIRFTRRKRAVAGGAIGFRAIPKPCGFEDATRAMGAKAHIFFLIVIICLAVPGIWRARYLARIFHGGGGPLDLGGF
jgi:hypothetical protein